MKPCYIFWHLWSYWTQGIGDYYLTQSRLCSRCGKMQLRTII